MKLPYPSTFGTMTMPSRDAAISAPSDSSRAARTVRAIAKIEELVSNKAVIACAALGDDLVLRRLLAPKPTVRSPSREAHEPELVLTRSQPCEAVLKHLYGEQLVGAARYEGCRAGHGTFAECVVLTALSRACSNCHFSQRASKCSLQAANKAKTKTSRMRKRTRDSDDDNDNNDTIKAKAKTSIRRKRTRDSDDDEDEDDHVIRYPKQQLPQHQQQDVTDAVAGMSSTSIRDIGRFLLRLADMAEERGRDGEAPGISNSRLSPEL